MIINAHEILHETPIETGIRNIYCSLHAFDKDPDSSRISNLDSNRFQLILPETFPSDGVWQ
jgi:hypothetical protein